MSNFDKIIEFQKCFGLDTNTELQKNIFTDNPKLVKLRWELIREEVDELHQAINEHDMTEVIDATADILYVVYGLATSFGFDANKAYDIVHKSNMSKLCKSEKEAQDTVENYRKLYETGKSPYDTPVYRKSEDGSYWIVLNESTGKILKSINYTPANFENLLKGDIKYI